MPGNRKITSKTIKGKEGIHPGSRKAGQLNRVHLRTAKLQGQARLRKGSSALKLQRPLFFLHALDSPHPLSLPSLRALISTVYLARFDARIEELEKERRAGRPKTKELLELEDVKKRENAEYETGMEVPDLTHAPTVKLMYDLLQSDQTLQPSHVDLFRQVRLFKNAPEEVVVSKEGRTANMGLISKDAVTGVGEDWTGGVSENKLDAGMEVEQ